MMTQEHLKMANRFTIMWLALSLFFILIRADAAYIVTGIILSNVWNVAGILIKEINK